MNCGCCSVLDLWKESQESQGHFDATLIRHIGNGVAEGLSNISKRITIG